ncbi:hypothetical protein [Flavobacterium sp.]|uniref:hypothetical protein n=1 Tax=Flavobacterium sp. TaxID=239 RepID=UPI003750514F
MKKILLIFALFFIFSFSASAQTEKKGLSIEKKEQSIEEKAKMNFTELTSVIALENSAMDSALTQLFVTKHKILSREGITEAEKKEVSNQIDAKLRATLNYESIQKLETKGVYKKLIN